VPKYLRIASFDAPIKLPLKFQQSLTQFSIEKHDSLQNPKLLRATLDLTEPLSKLDPSKADSAMEFYKQFNLVFEDAPTLRDKLVRIKRLIGSWFTE